MLIGQKKFVVIGGTGCVGNEILRQLATNGAGQVISVSRKGPSAFSATGLAADFLEPAGQQAIAAEAVDADFIINAAEPYTWPKGISPSRLLEGSYGLYQTLAAHGFGKYGQKFIRICTPVGRIPTNDQFLAVNAKRRPRYAELTPCPSVSRLVASTPYLGVKAKLDQAAQRAQSDLQTPIVTLSPTALTGPGSIHPAGFEIPLQFLLSPHLPVPRLVGNAVTIQAAAVGILAGCFKGIAGETYQLGGVDVEFAEYMNAFSDAAKRPRHRSVPFGSHVLQQMVLGGMLFSEKVLGDRIPWFMQSTPYAAGLMCGRRRSDRAILELGYHPTDRASLEQAIYDQVAQYRKLQLLP